MKYSVLLPTRNRLEYLKYAVTSVMQQNYDNWEIIISDNASEEDIAGYVRSLNEPRIKYSKSEKFLTITESWNRSLDLSSGDYVIMLGDDDILLKNYFQITKKLIEEFQNPDLIYTNSFLYAYPGVIPNFPKGVFQPFGALNGMPKHDEPFWLELPARLAIIEETLKFGSIYSTNMQHVLMSRSLIEKLKREEKFFHSPYPDVYAMSALFVEAEKVLIYPKEIVVIGVTPKSHGYYAFNNKQKEAIDFLNIKNEISLIPDMHHLLLPPYNSIHTFWLAAIYLLNKYFNLEKHNLRIDYNKYRNEQINNVFRSFSENKDLFQSEYKLLSKHLSFFEKATIISRKRLFCYAMAIAPNLVDSMYAKLKSLKKNKNKIVLCSPSSSFPENRFSNALEIFEEIEPKI